MIKIKPINMGVMVDLSGTILNQVYGQLKVYYKQLSGLNVARVLALPR